jgi:hypothetical protein
MCWTNLIKKATEKSPWPQSYRGNSTSIRRAVVLGLVQYNTPAQTEGLGNFHSWIGKNDLPIRGAAIIIGDPPNFGDGPDLVLLSVLVPPALAGLIPVIVG